MATNVWIDLPGVLIEPGTIVIGHVIVDNFPAIQPVSGTVTVNQGTSPWVVSGTITTSPNVNVHDGTGVSISSTGSSLNVDITNVVPVSQSGSWTVTANQGTSPWVISGTVTAVLSYDTNYGTVGVNTLRSAAQIGNATGAANFGAGTTTAQTLRVVLPTDQSAIPVSQSGIWTTGRTWTLSSGTDSINIGNFPATVAVTQSTSPWVISGTITANQGGTWNINNVTGTISLPTGASTAANQTTANTSLASIDSKLTAPLSVTETQDPNPFHRSGNVSTAATTQTRIMETAFTYTGSNVTPFIASGSANDTLAGTGAQKITITYYKADGSGPFTDTENMQGVTGFFAASTMAFIEKVQVTQVGSGGVNAGQILISNLAPLSTMAAIAAGENETFYCHHFVPLGKTAHITQFSYGSEATAVGQGGTFTLRKQSIPLASNPALAVTGDLYLVGTSSTDGIIFPTPIVVVGPAVIFGLITPDSATANTFTALIGGYEL